MKRSISQVLIAAMILAAPAVAASLSGAYLGSGWVAINYDKGAGVRPRAFALNVSVDAGVIDNYACSVTDATIEPFNVYMGNITIDNGSIVDRGSPVAPATAPDTPGQLYSNSIVIEMGSLYVPGTADPCEPATSGTLIKLHCSASDFTMNVTSNALRGKVVLEDGTVEDLTASIPTTHCDCCDGTPEDCAQAELVGCPDGWCYPRQCHGDADNKSQGKKNWWVSTNDLEVVLAAWNKPYDDGTASDLLGTDDIMDTVHLATGDDVPLINADFDHLPQGKKNWRVSTRDLDILLANWNIDNGPDPNCP